MQQPRRPWLQLLWEHLLQDELLRDPSAPQRPRYQPALDGALAYEIPLWSWARGFGLVFAVLATGAFVISAVNAIIEGPLF